MERDASASFDYDYDYEPDAYSSSSYEAPSLEQIHRQHFGFVWRTLRHLGVPADVLDDAVQDVFLVVHRQIEDFEGRASMRTWLWSIARRIAYRHRRTAERRQRKLDALAQQDPAGPNVEAEVARGQAAEILVGFLDDLSDEQRDVFVLHTLEGVTGSEIADALGVSVNTVHSRLRLARGRFEKLCTRLRVKEQRTLAQIRDAHQPPRGARGRAWAFMVPLLDLPGRTLKATTSWSVVEQAKIFALTVAVGTAGVVAAHGAGDRESAPGVSVASAASMVTPRERPTASSEPPVVEPEAPVAEVVVPPATKQPKPAPPRRASRLALETKLMREVRAAVEAEQPVRALALIAKGEREFANGAFEVERAAYGAISLCMAGREREGRGKAHLFLDAHPDTGIADQVRAVCLD